MKFFVFVALVFSLGLAIPRAKVHATSSTVRLVESEESESESEHFESDYTPVSVPTTPSSTVQPDTTTQSPTTTNTESTTTTSDQTTPTPTTTTAPTISTNFPWAWVTSRATGIASFVLLGLLSATGILLTTGTLFRLLSPAAAWSLHRAIGTGLLFSVLVHVFSLLFDSFINLRVVDLLIPFVSPYKPIFLALGIFGFYLLLLVLATSLYTMTSHAKFWRSVHFFAFPMYILIFLHSYLVGTDTKEWWMQIIYWGSAAVVGGAILYRLAWKYQTRSANRARLS